MIRVKVTLQDKRIPGRFIDMDLEEYKKFIEEQANILGITVKKEQGEKIKEIKGLIRPMPLSPEQFEKIRNIFSGHINKTENNLQCPRCGNEEFSPGAKYCKICGLPVGEEAKHE